jgi:outer membrane protein assembly factor BamB
MRRRDVLLSSSLLVSTSTGCLRFTETEEGSPAATDTNPASSQNTETALKQAWTIERDLRLWNDVASTDASNNLSYFTTYLTEHNGDGSVVAVNMDEGTIEWEYPKPSEVVFELKYLDGKLHLLDSNGTLTVLDATEGTQSWKLSNPYSSKSEADNPIWPGTISVGSDQVIVSVFDIDSEDDLPYLYAIGKESQSVEWKIAPETILDYSNSDGAVVTPEGISRIINGTVFIGFSRVTMSVEARDGTINWTQDTGAEGSISVAGDSIVVPAGSLSRINHSNGELQWLFDEGASQESNFVSKPVVFDDIIYATARDTMVYALNLENGRNVEW